MTITVNIELKQLKKNYQIYYKLIMNIEDIGVKYDTPTLIDGLKKHLKVRNKLIIGTHYREAIITSLLWDDEVFSESLVTIK